MSKKKIYKPFSLHRNEQDTAWKEILDAYLKEFMELCLPDLAKLIDWDQKIESLDKELQAISKGTLQGKRILDKLFKVFFKDGSTQRVFIHVEVQGVKDDDFPQRMFIYGYRIWDKYKKPLVSCAILTDNNKHWRPNHYEVELSGYYLGTKFLVVKVLDYLGTEQELFNSSNIFASVILVQLAAIKAKNKDPVVLEDLKFSLTRRLYEKGYDKQQISNLYTFIDWLFGLPEEYELEYLKKVYDLEEAKKMPYVTAAERFGIEKGREQGKLEDAKNLLKEGVEPAIIARATRLPLSTIKALQKESK